MNGIAYAMHWKMWRRRKANIKTVDSRVRCERRERRERPEMLCSGRERGSRSTFSTLVLLSYVSAGTTTLKKERNVISGRLSIPTALRPDHWQSACNAYVFWDQNQWNLVYLWIEMRFESRARDGLWSTQFWLGIEFRLENYIIFRNL